MSHYDTLFASQQNRQQVEIHLQGSIIVSGFVNSLTRTTVTIIPAKGPRGTKTVSLSDIENVFTV